MHTYSRRQLEFANGFDTGEAAQEQLRLNVHEALEYALAAKEQVEEANNIMMRSIAT